MQSMTGVIPGYHFGLVTYKCGVDFGYLISKLKCKDCGLYCSYNDMIDGCQNQWLQMMVGMSLGLFAGIILSILIYSFAWKYVGIIYRRLLVVTQIRSDNRANKTAALVGQLTGMNTNPIYKNKASLKDKYHGIAYKNRIVSGDNAIEMQEMPETKSSAVSSSDFEEIDVTEDCISSSRDTYPTNPTFNNQGQHLRNDHKAKKSLLYPVLTTIGLLSSLTPTSHACDMNFSSVTMVRYATLLSV